MTEKYLIVEAVGFNQNELKILRDDFAKHNLQGIIITKPVKTMSKKEFIELFKEALQVTKKA